MGYKQKRRKRVMGAFGKGRPKRESRRGKFRGFDPNRGSEEVSEPLYEQVHIEGVDEFLARCPRPVEGDDTQGVVGEESLIEIFERYIDDFHQRYRG